MMDKPIQVLILDDHQLVLDGVKLMLQSSSEIECLATFQNASEVLTFLEDNHIDIVISDIEMPNMSGIEFCSKLKAKYPYIKLLALTMLVHHSVIKRMISAGADGFLIKNSGVEELLFAISEVYKGRNYYSKEVQQKIESGLVRKGSSRKIPSLSKREKDIVRLIMDQKSTNDIAAELFISAGTVETHRRNIMNKLGTKNAAGLVKFVIENRLL